MMNITEYLKFRKPYERTLRQLLLELDFFFEDVKGINISSVTHRLKDYNSAFQKALKESSDIRNLLDIAGIRIVVATVEEVEIIARFFSRKQDSNDLVIKWDDSIAKDDGYRARHIVVEFKGHYSRSMYPTRVEIQLQTILQHSYNFISRAWAYKNNYPYSTEWHQSFLEVSQELTKLDKKISELQEEFLTISASESENQPLTPLSFQRIIADIFSETVDLKNAVDLTRMLIDMGCDTNTKLKYFMSSPQILSLRQRFLNLKDESLKNFVLVIYNLPLHEFCLMFGTRLEAFNKMLDELESIVESKE